MVHDSQLKAAERPDNQYDFQEAFQFVAPILQEADLAIGNLELTLPGRPPYAGYPNFRCPDTLAATLRQAGFDLLVTANNHANDSGKPGILHTLEVLRQNGFHYTGTFADSLERERTYPLIIHQKGFKLAILNYTYGTNNPHIPEPCVVNTIDTAQWTLDLRQAKAQKPDLIIALLHWGDEYHLNENQEQQRLTQFLFDGGADLIIGAHPHVVQPVKILHHFSESGYRRGLVAYSLGNFISGQIKKHTDVGLLLEVHLQRHPLTGRVTLHDHQYIPIWRYRGYNQSGRRWYSIIPVSALERAPLSWPLSLQARTRMMAAVQPIREHLSRFNSSERVVSLGPWKEPKKEE